MESEMSSSRCMRWRSVPWFSFRLVVTVARKGFLASKGLGGEEKLSDWWDLICSPVGVGHEGPLL